jgi:predicted kinase
VAHGVAGDNLLLGHRVIADSVNPIAASRAGWREVAARAAAGLVQVELICSDRDEHRRRVAARTADIAGHVLPGWDEIVGRAYEPWTGDVLVIDTATQVIDASVRAIVAALPPVA